MKIISILTIGILVSLLASTSFVGVVPSEALFNLSSVAYYDRVKNAFLLAPEQQAMLRDYGFVVIRQNASGPDAYFRPDLRFEDFYFEKVYGQDLPVIITTDSILHLFHVAFDCSLKILEERTFYPILAEITQFAFESSLDDYLSTPHDDSVKFWAVRNSTIYFAVAASLLNGTTVTLPEELVEDVTFFLDETWSETPRFMLAGFWNSPEPPNGTMILYDFTQFTVRGHYLHNPKLERYFQALMWFGRFPIYVLRNDECYDWILRHFDERSIVYIRDILKSDLEIYENWLLLYNVTSTLIGESDSVNLLNLEIALHNAFGEDLKYFSHVASEDGLAALKEELSHQEYRQQILGQALLAGMPVMLPRYPIVFHFMGQRFVPDSYIFQRLCWDKVGFNSDGQRRLMPKGLDVFAVLGSERASQLLIPDYDYASFKENLQALKDHFSEFNNEDWTSSSYMVWVHALQSLVNIEYGDCYPRFMRNVAWRDEKLNTALGSWAQLRHDTILYAKQTYIPGLVCSYPEAFVEPNPEFYLRMQRLVNKTMEAIGQLQPTANISPIVLESLAVLLDVAEKLEVVSEKELAREALSKEENDFIKQLVWGCGSGGFRGWYVDTIHRIAGVANSSSSLEAPLIADVATFPGDVFDPPQILHVGVGYVNALVVLFPKPDGKLVAAVGPVFSYYEFPLIGTKRLNDDEWKEMVISDNSSEYIPKWFEDVYAMGLPWPVPEFPTNSFLIALIATVVTAITFVKTIRTRKKRMPHKDHAQ